MIDKLYCHLMKTLKILKIKFYSSIAVAKYMKHIGFTGIKINPEHIT